MNILSASDPVSALQVGLSQQVVEPRSNLTAWLGWSSIARSTPQLAESWWSTTRGKISWGAPSCPVHLSGSRCRWFYRYAEIFRWRPMCTFKDKGVYTCRLFWLNRLWFISFLGSMDQVNLLYLWWKNWELSSCAVERIERGYGKDKSWLASSAHRKKM